MKVTLIGCGGWGARIAHRLDTFPDVRLVVVDEVQHRAQRLADEITCEHSHDPVGYLAVTGTQESSTRGGAVVIATPPDTHLEVLKAVLSGYGIVPRFVRIEKPLACSLADAEEIVRLCADAGVKLTVGFTLLHDPSYEAAFDYLRIIGAPVTNVVATRIGRRARHRAHPALDLGIHAAAIAAHLGVPCRLDVGYSDTAVVRHTRINGMPHSVVLDEVAGTLTTPAGELHVGSARDALTRDLEAWLAGTHRGTPEVALTAQRIACDLIETEAKAPS